MIEKLVEVGNLFDFYGNLLSERQYKVVELFYIDDLSLSEIGELLGISRQSVYDTLKRAEDNLYKYEETLKLGVKFNIRNKDLKNILELTDELRDIVPNNQDALNKIENIEKIVIDVLKLGWEGVE